MAVSKSDEIERRAFETCGKRKKRRVGVLNSTSWAIAGWWTRKVGRWWGWG
jgi:hypothetical protein